MGSQGRNKDRTLVQVPDTTMERLHAFRAREWPHIPVGQRSRDVSWNAVLNRLLDIEAATRPSHGRHERRQARGPPA